MNEQEEKKLLEKSESGDPSAKYQLGLMYGRKGEGQDNMKALQFFRPAAEMGYIGAQYHMASIFYEGIKAGGEGTDFHQALFWIEFAVKQEHACSQFVLGMMHEKGEVKNDGQDASYWYNKAAEHGCVSALSKLGAMCNQGVTRDKCKAFIWFYIAKENGQEGLDEVLKQLREEIEEEQEKPLNDIEDMGIEIRRLCKVTKKYKEAALSSSLCAVCCKL